MSDPIRRLEQERRARQAQWDENRRKRDEEDTLCRDQFITSNERTIQLIRTYYVEWLQRNRIKPRRPPGVRYRGWPLGFHDHRVDVPAIRDNPEYSYIEKHRTSITPDLRVFCLESGMLVNLESASVSLDAQRVHAYLTRIGMLEAWLRDHP